MTSSSGHVMASGDHGSSSRVPVISEINEAGERNTTPAHTPSLRPSSPVPRPNRCDSRWDSQRSTPRAGTTTRSSANGSGGGVASSSPRPSARMSVRSARWMWKAIAITVDRATDRRGRVYARTRTTTLPLAVRFSSDATAAAACSKG